MISRLIIQTLLWLAVMALLLFVPAGTADWPAAWVFLAETGVLGLVVGLWLARHDPDLLKERLASPVQREQKAWDKFFMVAFLALWSGWLVLMALDAVRYRWSAVPLWAQGLGAVGVFLSVYVGHLTFRANSYAAPVVKIQKDRGQKVVTTGPYRIVRHPLYAGAICFLIGAPLLLGSWYGFVLVPVLMAVLVVRIVMEERTLAVELEGYAEYAARVRYRLIPMIW